MCEENKQRNFDIFEEAIIVKMSDQRDRERESERERDRTLMVNLRKGKERKSNEWGKN
jgi:hypothetical protein